MQPVTFRYFLFRRYLLRQFEHRHAAPASLFRGAGDSRSSEPHDLRAAVCRVVASVVYQRVPSNSGPAICSVFPRPVVNNAQRVCNPRVSGKRRSRPQRRNAAASSCTVPSTAQSNRCHLCPVRRRPRLPSTALAPTGYFVPSLHYSPIVVGAWSLQWRAQHAPRASHAASFFPPPPPPPLLFPSLPHPSIPSSL